MKIKTLVESGLFNYANLIAGMFAFILLEFPSQENLYSSIIHKFKEQNALFLDIKHFLNESTLLEGARKNLLLRSSVSRSKAGAPFSLVSEICSRNGRIISCGSDPCCCWCNPSEPIGFNPWARILAIRASRPFSWFFFLGRPSSASQTLFTLFTFNFKVFLHFCIFVFFTPFHLQLENLDDATANVVENLKHLK